MHANVSHTTTHTPMVVTLMVIMGARAVGMMVLRVSDGGSDDGDDDLLNYETHITCARVDQRDVLCIIFSCYPLYSALLGYFVRTWDLKNMF